MPALTPTGALDQFGQLIREARDARGWSQKELADHAGIAQSEISALELGHRSDVKSSTILKLATALELDASTLSAAALQRHANVHEAPSRPEGIAPQATAQPDTEVDDAEPVSGAA